MPALPQPQRPARQPDLHPPLTGFTVWEALALPKPTLVCRRVWTQ